MLQIRGLIVFCLVFIACQGANGEYIEEIDIEDVPYFLGNVKPHDESINYWFDLVFANLRQMIDEKGLDPIELPSDSDNFTATLFNNEMDGFVSVGDGAVSGIGTIHRAGDMILETYQNETANELIVGGTCGLIDLEANYNTHFDLGPFRSNFGVTIRVSFVGLEFLTDIFVLPSDIVFEECGISEMRTIHLTLNGMGIFDTRIYNLVANALLQVLEEPLTNALSGIACKLVLAALNGA